MKKLLLIAAAIAFIGLVSCNKQDNPSQDDGYEIEGYWYEESYNEETHFYGNGKFYDRFANYQRTAETEGTYEYNKETNKLTEYYVFIGQNQVINCNIKWKNENQFSLSSTSFSALTLERIISRHSLKVGQTAKINTNDIVVLSYESKNPRIVSVDDQGQIKAEGEKGTTYIKLVTSAGNLWASATVGDNTYDLWCDYTQIIGMSFNEMRDELSILGKPAAVDSDGDFYYFGTPSHDILDGLCVLLDLQKDEVVAIELLLKDAVSDHEINSYLNSKYYPQTEGKNDTFYTNEDIHDSNVLISSSIEDGHVVFFDKGYVFISGLWGVDFAYMLGKDSKVVKNLMEGYGCSFVMTDYSYSQDGSDYYITKEDDVAYMVGYVFNPDKIASQLWIYLNETSDPNQIFASLYGMYYYSEAESTNRVLVFYDKDKNLKINFDLDNIAVIYTDLTVKQHTAPTKGTAVRTAHPFVTAGVQYGLNVKYLGDDTNSLIYKYMKECDNAICVSKKPF